MPNLHESLEKMILAMVSREPGRRINELIIASGQPQRLYTAVWQVVRYLVTAGQLTAKSTTCGEEYYLPHQLKVRGVLASKLRED